MMFPKKKRKQNASLLESIRLLPCCICGNHPVDASHIKTRGSGGPDEYFNVVPKCRTHHQEWGQYGWKKFCERYKIMKYVLSNRGWKVDRWGELYHDKLRHPTAI